MMAHANDYQNAPLIAILAPYHNSLIPAETVAKFGNFTGEHTYTTSAYSPPHDAVPRNITTWVAANMTIGAASYDEDILGGPRNDTSQWNPAVVQWGRSDGSLGYLTLQPTEDALQVGVEPGSLNLTYPRGTADSIFTFFVNENQLGGKRDVTSMSDIAGLKVKVAGTVDTSPLISYCGLIGGTCASVQ